jgi:hypothetical protein
MIMKMKKAVLANKFKFSILRSVSKTSTYPFTISAVVRELRSALKDFADVKNPAEVVKAGNPAIVALAQAINSNTKSVKAMTRAYQTAISKIVDLEKSIARMTAEGAAYGLAAKKTKSVDKKKVIYFSSDGDLYREPKAKHCYEMGKEKQRQKIVRVLLERKTFVPTDELVLLTGSKNRKALHNAKLMINRKAKYNLGVENFITGRSVSGYKINPEYKIKQV